MIDADTRAFYERHCATPAGIVIAHCYDADGEEIATGVFSCLSKAHDWADTLDDVAAAAIFTPYIIDEPDYGQVPKEDHH